MINPIYKFEIVATYDTTTNTRTVYPIYKGDLTIEWEKESNEEYFRGKLDGKLNFVGGDYDWIMSVNYHFETEYILTIYISYDDGGTWTQYWRGRFYKTDCEINVDDKKITVTPEVYDNYNDVLSGIDNEYKLTELLPELADVNLDKRPLLQIYSPNEETIGCFLSGMWWEQDCEATAESDLDDYHFARLAGYRQVVISGSSTEAMNGLYWGTMTSDPETFEYTKGEYTFKCSYESSRVAPQMFTLRQNGELLYYFAEEYTVRTGSYQITMTDSSREPITVSVRGVPIYARMICDVDEFTVSGTTYTTSAIPSDDIVDNNRNYTRCIGFTAGSGVTLVYYTTAKSSTPTEYGLYATGQYYTKPTISGITEFYPIAKTTWDEVSVWFAYSNMNWVYEAAARKTYTLKNTYDLSSVISKLLGKYSSVTHAATTDYSQFLYASLEPVRSQYNIRLFFAPKKNIKQGLYDRPVNDAEISLRKILDMLRDCFRCYWWVDDSNRFRIEHIKYFNKGGTYTGSPQVGVDLTTMKVSRNGKAWDYNKSTYSFDSLEMPQRYEFEWMDSATQLFQGYPIEMESKFVTKGEVETVNISNFVSDIDYMVLEPDEFDDSGYVLLGARQTDGVWKLPYRTFSVNNVNYVLQNSDLSFYYLQKYYLWDLPAWHIDATCYDMNGSGLANGIKKQKKQEVEVPLSTDLDLQKLVKTSVGSGKIESLSVTLSSRMAEASLRFNTTDSL